MKQFLVLIVVSFSTCGPAGDQEGIRRIGNFENTKIWALAQAADDGNIKEFAQIAKSLSEHLDVREEHYGLTLLMWCVKMEKYQMVKILLEDGADPNVRSDDGKTALFFATEYSWLDNESDPDPRYVKLLLQFGADPNIAYAGDGRSNVIYPGTTPLIHAASRSLLKVKALVEAGADIDYKTARNWTAANQALSRERVDIAHYLIVDKKADVTQPYYYYRTGSDSVNYDDVRYPVELLKYWIVDLGSEEHKTKMEIVDEFARQGVDYRATAPSPTTLEQIRELYPETWKAYLKAY